MIDQMSFRIAAVVFSVLSAQPAAALTLSGLGPLQGLAGATAEVQVSEDVLTIDPQESGAITIAPWPAYLPQGFAKQHVYATRMLHPAGPVDRVELRALSAAQPWLIVISGLRLGQQVVGNWSLDSKDGRWILRAGKAWRALPMAGAEGRAVSIRAETAWCVYLIDAQNQARPDAALAHETEPQVALAAVRKLGRDCRATNTGR